MITIIIDQNIMILLSTLENKVWQKYYKVARLDWLVALLLILVSISSIWLTYTIYRLYMASVSLVSVIKEIPYLLELHIKWSILLS